MTVLDYVDTFEFQISQQVGRGVENQLYSSYKFIIFCHLLVMVTWT